jgi:hypothetical protein
MKKILMLASFSVFHIASVQAANYLGKMPYQCLASTQTNTILMISVANSEPDQIQDVMYFPHLKQIDLSYDSAMGVGNPPLLIHYSYFEMIKEKQTGEYTFAVNKDNKILFAVYTSPQLSMPISFGIQLNLARKEALNRKLANQLRTCI